MAIPQARQAKETEVGGHAMYTLLEPGAIPAIFAPDFVTVRQAEEFYYPNEPLIVVSDSTAAKGYSTWHLDNHEVVNDSLNGSAIAVTW